MQLEIKDKYLLRIWKYFGLMPVKIKIIKGSKIQRKMTFSTLALVQTLIIFIVTMLSHVHYIRGNWTDFKKKRYYLTRPLQIVSRLVSSFCMTLTNAMFVISSPILAKKFIKLYYFMKEIEGKLVFEKGDKGNGNILIIFAYGFYIFHISLHLLACLILIEWKEIESLNSIVLMYLNDFVILAGGLRWFYVIQQLQVKYNRLNKTLKLTIDWKHAYLRDFSLKTKENLLKIWRLVGLAPIKIQGNKGNQREVVSKLAYLYSVSIFAVTFISHIQYIWKNVIDYTVEHYDPLTISLQIMPRLVSTIFMFATDFAFLLSSKRVTVKLLEKLNQYKYINKRLKTDDYKVNLLSILFYCFFLFHITFHLTSSLILVGWLNFISLSSILLMYLNDFIILAGGLRWFYIVYYIQNKFSSLNKALQSAIATRFLYINDSPSISKRGCDMSKTWETVQTETVQELISLHMSLTEISEYIISLFGPEILIYTVYLIAEIILVQYDVIIMLYIVSEIRPQSYPYYTSRVIKLILRFIEVIYLTYPCYAASKKSHEFTHVLFSNRKNLNKETQSRVKTFLNHYKRLQFDICGFFTLSLHTIMAILSLATSYLVIAVQFIK